LDCMFGVSFGYWQTGTLNAPAERRSCHRLRDDSFTYTAYRTRVPGVHRER
jgi:hypothetical protein